MPVTPFRALVGEDALWTSNSLVREVYTTHILSCQTGTAAGGYPQAKDGFGGLPKFAVRAGPFARGYWMNHLS
jgi:hypothetical protein